jgi:hypothetical protein
MAAATQANAADGREAPFFHRRGWGDMGRNVAQSPTYMHGLLREA